MRKPMIAVLLLIGACSKDATAPDESGPFFVRRTPAGHVCRVQSTSETPVGENFRGPYETRGAAIGAMCGLLDRAAANPDRCWLVWPGNACGASDAVALIDRVEPATTAIVGTAADVAEVRELRVDVNTAALDATTTQSRPMRVELFEGDAVMAQVARTPANASTPVWQGNISGDPEGYIIVSRANGAVAGTVYAHDRMYEISKSDGEEVLREVDRDAFPREREPIAPPPSPQPRADVPPEAPAAADATPPVIDVLIVYTAAARGTGTPSDMQSFAAATLANANHALANSGNAARLRPAGTATEVTYDENAPVSPHADFWDAALNRLSGTSDGFMDGVHTLRVQNNADIVVLLTKAAPDACGIGFVMQTPSNAFRTSAFAVVRKDCSTSNHSFAHEIGHLLGCCHDRPSHPNCGGAFTDSFGLQVASRFRTVMAYPCTSTPPCPREPFFSNPAVTFKGTPTGVSGAEHNARTIDQTAATVAGFRP